MEGAWNRRLAGLVLALIVFGLDQLVKWLVTGPLELDSVGDVQQLLPFFDLRFTQNFGISLGLFEADSLQVVWSLRGLDLRQYSQICRLSGRPSRLEDHVWTDRPERLVTVVSEFQNRVAEEAAKLLRVETDAALRVEAFGPTKYFKDLDTRAWLPGSQLRLREKLFALEGKLLVPVPFYEWEQCNNKKAYLRHKIAMASRRLKPESEPESEPGSDTSASFSGDPVE